MLNQIFLVGRLVRDPNLKELENGKKVTYVTLAVPRSYKNMDGIYETDYIECILWDHIAKNTKEYCRKGDMITVRGRIQTRTYEKDNQKRYVTEIIAEKVTFLSTNNNNKNAI